MTKSKPFLIIFAIFVGLIAVLLSSSDEINRLIKVGGNFTTKNVCSGVFISTMSPSNVLEFELSGLAAWLFKFDVDFDEKYVEAYVVSKPFSRFVGLAISKSYFIEGRGCVFSTPESIRSKIITPIGVQSEIKYDAEIQSFLNFQVSPAAFKRNQTRGVLVMHRGAVVGEAYQTKELNIDANSRLLGWSMTKTVHAMIVGAAVQQNLLTLDTPLELDNLDLSHLQTLLDRNNGKAITFGDLITMSDIIPCEENYEFTGLVPDMLFNSDDHGQHAASCSTNKILQRKMNIGGAALPLSLKSFNYNVTESKFGFYYSSSASNLLAREFRKLFKSDDEYLNFPNKYLFGPIGASSFILETDPSGTFVASSFGYASPRDWAKLGDIVRRRGVASDGSRVIPEQFVDFMLTARSFSGGHYGGSIWLNPARVGVGEYNFLGPDDKDKRRFRWMTRAVPQDAAMMSGFNGQYVMVIPSLDCVIVRLGFTPGVWEAGIGDEDDIQVPFNNYLFFRTLSDHCARLNENN